jgi:uncharacterized protein (UPF0305 family)
MEFKQKWERRYPGRTFTPRPQHFKQVKELLTPVEGFAPLELTEIVERMHIYLKTDFYKVCAHNFSKFVEHFDTFIPPPPKIPPGTNMCKGCGVVYRIGDNHRCSVERSGDRKTKDPVLLQNLLPPQESRHE